MTRTGLLVAVAGLAACPGPAGIDNSPPEVMARPEVARLRSAERGFELTAELGVSEPVAVGTEAVVFLVHSAVFSTWADFNAQGVFLSGDAG